jgi:hypothetical protein
MNLRRPEADERLWNHATLFAMIWVLLSFVFITAV